MNQFVRFMILGTSLVVLFFLGLTAYSSDHKIPEYVLPKHRESIKAWLASHTQYRLAIETDCSNCRESIKMIRTEGDGDWKPSPSYQPYYAIGDFNSDNSIDFAVAIIDTRKRENNFIIMVFNGPFLQHASRAPVFISEPMDLSNEGLFYGPPRPKPWRLLVGPFESEGILLLPKGKSYKWEESQSE